MKRKTAKKKPLTKQAAYARRMRAIGYSGTEVLAHDDDKPKIREFAQQLREKRGYDGQPKEQQYTRK